MQKACKIMVEKLEERNFERFVIALPFVDIGIPEYERINHRGGSVATTPASAVSHYVFRKIQNKIIARTIVANLRDKYGGAGSYAMELPERFMDDNNVPMTGSDAKSAEEIEVASYFARCYGRRGIDRTAIPALDFLDDARRILREFERVRKRK